MTRRVIVPFSTGRQSFAAAVRARERCTGVELLFADVLVEDTDNYRFLRESVQVLGLPVHTVADGRTPWQVAFDEHMIPNSRVPLCSRRLKHEPSAAWMDEHAPDALVVTGIDWDEQERRLPGIVAGHAPREVWAPLCEPPYLFERDYDALIRSFGIEPPRMYAHGYAHANCAGACFRAGISAWVHLLKDSPALYVENELQEEAFRSLYGDHAILRHRSGPKEGQPLPLRELREMVQAGATIEGGSKQTASKLRSAWGKRTEVDSVSCQVVVHEVGGTEPAPPHPPPVGDVEHAAGEVERRDRRAMRSALLPWTTLVSIGADGPVGALDQTELNGRHVRLGRLRLHARRRRPRHARPLLIWTSTGSPLIARDARARSTLRQVELELTLAAGIAECARVTRGWVLAKCCDYTNGRQFHLGHVNMIQAAAAAGLRCHDLIVHAAGSGPGGGQILTPLRARRAHSYLCVFTHANRSAAR